MLEPSPPEVQRRHMFAGYFIVAITASIVLYASVARGWGASLRANRRQSSRCDRFRKSGSLGKAKFHSSDQVHSHAAMSAFPRLLVNIPRDDIDVVAA